MTGDRNRLGDAVDLLMDAVVMLNNQGEVAKRIDDFLSTIHPAECVELPEEPEGERLKAIALKLNGIANAMASVVIAPNAAQMEYWRKTVEEAYDLARAGTPEQR